MVLEKELLDCLTFRGCRKENTLMSRVTIVLKRFAEKRGGNAARNESPTCREEKK